MLKICFILKQMYCSVFKKIPRIVTAVPAGSTVFLRSNSGVSFLLKIQLTGIKRDQPENFYDQSNDAT
jgi:hypothetical protein